ncbi:hypothetical protein GCM10010289_81270 [Streptomyces violascens]|uniref:Uncharacterized protein n=1 Tax=Streptomyces violascens TaxID=67381 RepID=A0ABQ3QRK3_9ACTN|nr:hypothetical protein GCM10010289_81270 [Streptomyces violascens]GHI39897.1 hypothetical protein Sviol_43050 [Streptomyces violascens]
MRQAGEAQRTRPAARHTPRQRPTPTRKKPLLRPNQPHPDGRCSLTPRTAHPADGRLCRYRCACRKKTRAAPCCRARGVQTESSKVHKSLRQVPEAVSTGPQKVAPARHGGGYKLGAVPLQGKR